MKLNKIEINSYRSCTSTKLDLHEELTALIGINGAGKSNILNSVLLLKKILQRTRFLPTKERETLFSHCQIKFDIEHDKKQIYVRGDIYYETDEKNLDDVQFAILKWNFKEFTGSSKWYEIPVEFLSQAFSDQMSIEYSRRNPTQFYKFYKLRDTLPKTIFPLLPKIGEFFNGINYYSASQFSDPSKCPISIELEENRPIRKFRSYSTGHEQFILDLFRAFEENSKVYKRYFNAIGKDGLGLIDSIDFKKVDMPSNTFEIKTGGRIKQIERTRSIVVPNFFIDGVNLSPNQLSEGTLKTLALLFYTITDDSKLLLIEEPEVCIHHGLLNSIYIVNLLI